MATKRRVQVTWTVEYETDYTPPDENAVDGAVERLMELIPQDVLMSDGSEMEAVGWCVEHPDWGDMRMGTLMTVPVPVEPAPWERRAMGVRD